MIRTKSDAFITTDLIASVSKTIHFTYNVNNNDNDDDDDLQRMYCLTCRSPLIFLITVSL